MHCEWGLFRVLALWYVEPEAVTDGEGGRFAGEDEVPAWWYVFNTPKGGSGGEGEEVDTAKDVGGKVEEECGGSNVYLRRSHGLSKDGKDCTAKAMYLPWRFIMSTLDGVEGKSPSTANLGTSHSINRVEISSPL